MNTKTRLAIFGFIAGLSAILLTINQADVALAEPSGDKGRCDTSSDDCSDWGDATRDNTDGLGEHSADPSNDGIGNDDDGTSDDGNPDNDDNTEKHDPRVGLANVLPSHPSELGCALDSNVC
jgi:hypothetical protein